MNEGCQAYLRWWISGGELTFPSVKAMLHLLKVVFDDPNRVQHAKLRLYSNKHPSNSFPWISEIKVDAAISGYDKFAEPLRDTIIRNLSMKLKQAFIYKKGIENLDLDSAMARLQDTHNKKRPNAAPASKFRFRAPTTPDVNNTQPNEHLTTTQGGDSMDLSASYSRPRGPFSEEEKGRRHK
ncbi:hypothetical protein EV44_g3482 [Erysiphe necator]|uniref:Uncharacterized protein n=1 Tax=Uncinula necator TaxID=52586 RepID=A0A0B1P3L2_UNCNE|nr:hypothetical protein EV44_g3482 [Erysiphe necator]